MSTAVNVIGWGLGALLVIAGLILLVGRLVKAVLSRFAVQSAASQSIAAACLQGSAFVAALVVFVGGMLALYCVMVEAPVFAICLTVLASGSALFSVLSYLAALALREHLNYAGYSGQEVQS